MSKLLKIAFTIVLIVIVLGAWTRLSDAGLGCPDWPTCYGKIIVSTVDDNYIQNYERKLEPYKAWMEMIHRYAAMILGLLAIAIFILSFKEYYRKLNKLASLLLIVVLLQGALGAFTVTELVHPLIVSAHLIGGFITAIILFALNIKIRNKQKITILKKYRKIINIAIAIVFIQIFLGGWVSTNYAALSCGNYFPSCLGSYIHPMNFTEMFFIGDLGVDYEYGVLSAENRAGIQIIHRFFAIFVIIAILLTTIKLRIYSQLRINLIIILLLLISQLTLGVLNIVLSLPIVIATMHNLVALLLLLSLFKLKYKTRNNLQN